MNLKINFEENVNNDRLHLQKTPFRVYENGATLAKWSRSETIITRDFSDISEIIDLNEFAHETAMGDIVAFNQYLDEINNSYSRILNLEGSNYVFGVSKKYAWKPGIYDAIRLIINNLTDMNKRAAKLETIFNRRKYGEYGVENFEYRMKNLSRLRDNAKNASGNLIDSIDELMETQSNVINQITESTAQANAMSDKFKIYNYITNVSEHSQPSFTSMKLWTIVIVEPNEMTIVNNDGGELFKLPTPKLILTFNRRLYKVLSGQRDYNPTFKAHALQGRHPYINSPYLWSEDGIGNSSEYPWGVLCLSAFQDDIVRSLGKNDYKSFLMGIMNWNSIYNNSETNPYVNPREIYQLVGFPEKESLDEARKKRSYITWDENICWENNISWYQSAELDSIQRSINARLNIPNYSLYSKYVIQDCNKKQCIFREECSRYIRANNVMTSSIDWKEIVESFIGFIYEDNTSYRSLNVPYQRALSKLIGMSVLDRFEYLESNLLEMEYWSDINPEDQMRRKLTQWQQAVNEERRPNYDG